MKINKMMGSKKYFSLLWLALRFSVKWPTNKTTCGLYYKQVMIIIYDRNDSGQYYKTTITIVIDDPSLS